MGVRSDSGSRSIRLVVWGWYLRMSTHVDTSVYASSVPMREEGEEEKRERKVWLVIFVLFRGEFRGLAQHISDDRLGSPAVTAARSPLVALA